ncbi:hypothetical protein F5Y18DRAFT_434937 [Xylariaceae sp. FL1019]|nr:hypothetical protein F5Y18DRAFT_434937 [Xylariaceae sp. FL1019]
MSEQETQVGASNTTVLSGESEDKSETTPDKDTRYHMVLSEWNSRTGEFQEMALTERTPEYGPHKNRAFVFRKLTGIRGSRRPDLAVASSSEFDIVFPPLQKLLGRITSRWGWAEPVTRCSSPYMPLIYSWDEAWKEAWDPHQDESSDVQLARTDLREMLRIIHTSSGDVRVDRYFKNRESFLSEGTITHDALWTLFPPGTLIMARPCHGEPQVFVTDHCDGFVSDDDTFDLVCFCFDWDGSRFKRVPFQLGIKGWGGDRKSVTWLPFYPLKFYEEEGLDREQSIQNLRKNLIKRGIEYADLCRAEKGKQMFNYQDGDAFFHTGGAFLHHSESDLSADLSRQQTSSSSTTSLEEEIDMSGSTTNWKPVDGAVIVDFASYLTYQSVTAPILGALGAYKGSLVELSPERRAKNEFKDMYRLEWDRHSPGTDISDEQYLCCPPRVLGYALNLKTWVQLLVDNIKDADEANDSTFQDKLQLDEDEKSLIAKSVKAHSELRKRGKGTSSRGLDDFAPGKGRGLVIMLYGQPGVGKTLTAESVAQMTRKPLLSVGVSDIGIEGDKVEINLQKIFALAGLWEAVLLFDEADVFLESRGEGDNDLRRNAMVSVLLRVLEYYEGILILTTNRMKSLDIAVQSRIHLAVKFADLTGDQTLRIYESFLTQLDNKGLVTGYKDIMKWVKAHGRKFEFNGRQIRNVISTALGVAQADNRKLTREDLMEVAGQTDMFKRDLAGLEAVFNARQMK